MIIKINYCKFLKQISVNKNYKLMCKFGLEIISVSRGTTCPESLAQYDRNIHMILFLLILSIHFLLI